MRERVGLSKACQAAAELGHTLMNPIRDTTDAVAPLVPASPELPVAEIPAAEIPVAEIPVAETPVAAASVTEDTEDTEGIESIPEHVAADFTAPPEANAVVGGAKPEDDPYLQDSALAQEAFDRAVSESGVGNEERALLFFLSASKQAEAAREWYLAAIANHQAGEIFRTPEPPYDLERAFRMYRRAIYAYEQCGHFDEARKLSYRLMSLKMRRAGELEVSWGARIELVVYWFAAGFGYRPLRVVRLAAVIIVGYGLLYWLLDGVRGSDAGVSVGFWQALYFSGITFSTVGFGDFVPAPHMRLLAFSEGALGAFVMSFFVVVLANRLRH